MSVAAETGRPRSWRIPFDSLCLAAVVCELRALVGARIQRVLMTDPHTLVLAAYGHGSERWLLLSCHPEFARVHLIARRPVAVEPTPSLVQALRARAVGARLLRIEQIGFDRILEIGWEGAEGAHTLIAELMGKHSNLILVEAAGKVVACAHRVPPAKSRRPIVPGQPYLRPPFAPKASLLKAADGDDLSGLEGASPFLVALLAAKRAAGEPDALAQLANVGRSGSWRPVVSPGHGVYPVSVAALGIPEHPRESLSEALEARFAEEIAQSRSHPLKSTLLAQLGRVKLAREVALAGVREAELGSSRAARLQRMGELILSGLSAIPTGAAEFQTLDYEGSPILIPLDPQLDAKENAAKLFERARQAKARAKGLKGQEDRLASDLEAIMALENRVAEADGIEGLEELEREARVRRWLQREVTAGPKADRPYGGHRIRELLGPGGVRVLYGENATSNDYLTTRVGRPSDWWLHVRGSTSAHVLIPTNNQPDRIAPEALEFAALIAARNSPSRHSSLVAVDCTLRKHVRKPKGAPTGAVLYTHEKTLHVRPAV
ncbi:MAG: NFACT family protein [Fimbriimonas ginsengisoli]|uniref:NFACT family protein n=1 Tax=Fimbriimonas ginsengisoli TaxID=1005039 RepID=A0A931PVZ5_FIMGI|nr:NFACT family protein [Fimbriimonas ginsengisoli]